MNDLAKNARENIQQLIRISTRLSLVSNTVMNNLSGSFFYFCQIKFVCIAVDICDRM